MEQGTDGFFLVFSDSLSQNVRKRAGYGRPKLKRANFYKNPKRRIAQKADFFRPFKSRDQIFLTKIAQLLFK